MEFSKKFGKRDFLDKLDIVAANNSPLVEKWILNSKKNPIYKYNKGIVTKGSTEYYALIDWTLPDTKYQYKVIKLKDLNDDYKLKRSSIIPFVKVNNQKYWLLGSFHDYEKTNTPILTDFAGTCEKRDFGKNRPAALECALRELHEESKGLLDDIVEKRLTEDNVVVFEGKNEQKKEKVIFIFVLIDMKEKEFENIQERFNQSYSKEKFGPLGASLCCSGHRRSSGWRWRRARWSSGRA